MTDVRRLSHNFQFRRSSPHHFTSANSLPPRIPLKGENGKYVTSNWQLAVTADKVSSNETFTVTVNDSNLILQASNGKYAGAEQAASDSGLFS
jgi:hypothetical protein